MENTKSAKSESEINCAFNNAATLLNKGLVKAVEVSKSTLDLAVEQNQEFVASCKKALKSTPLPLFGFDLASSAFESCIALQKSLLDLAVDQNNAIFEAAQQHSFDAGNVKAGINTLVQKTMDNTLAAQNLALNFAAKQTKAITETVKQQPGVTGSPVETVTDSVQRGVDTMLAAQKEMLNTAAKTAKSTAAKA
jgi:hypothetical protein